jgi:glycosyltransferase involved in cell wall biosynthesis
VPTLLFTGRLIQRKGVEFLVESLPHILAKRKVRLVITGDGDRRDGIAALVRRLGLEDVVDLLGFVSQERLRELYASSDVYVLPAVYDDGGDTEGLGVPLIEAALHGLPIVATGIGGIIDVVRDRETGLWAPERDPLGIANAVLEVLEDPDLASSLGEAAREYAQERFAWSRITDDLMEVYREVLEAPALVASRATGV